MEQHIREAGLSGEAKRAWRQAYAVPALAELHAWMTEKYASVKRPTSRMRKALEYTLKRWDKLTVYADTDLRDPDNNRVENPHRKRIRFSGIPAC